MKQARALLEVVAGVLPGTPEPELTKQWALTSDDWQENGVEALKKLNDEAQAYAAKLMLRPDRFNWVKTEWIWL